MGANAIRLIWTISVPFLLLFSSFCIVVTLKLLKLINYKYKFLTLLLGIIFKYQYFGIIYIYFSSIRCTNIGDEYYLISNLKTNCKYEENQINVLIFVLAVLTIMSLFIPLVSFLLIRKNI
jgi:hypothetical protein